jgi:hypothetical protein
MSALRPIHIVLGSLQRASYCLVAYLRDQLSMSQNIAHVEEVQNSPQGVVGSSLVISDKARHTARVSAPAQSVKTVDVEHDNSVSAQ